MLKKTDSGSAADWLCFAFADLAAVKLLVDHETSFRVCRSKLAEALEKILKGDLISRGWVLEKTHDLQRLCDVLASKDSERAAVLQPTVDDLAEAYTADRYPGFDADDDEEEWAELRSQLAAVEAYGLIVRLRIDPVNADGVSSKQASAQEKEGIE